MQQLVEDELQRVLLLTSELIWARSIWAASFWARSIWSGSISAELTWYILPLPVWLILSSRSIWLIWSIKSFWSTWLIWYLWTSRPIWLRLSLVIVFVSSHSPSLSQQILIYGFCTCTWCLCPDIVLPLFRQLFIWEPTNFYLTLSLTLCHQSSPLERLADRRSSVEGLSWWKMLSCHRFGIFIFFLLISLLYILYIIGNNQDYF